MRRGRLRGRGGLTREETSGTMVAVMGDGTPELNAEQTDAHRAGRRRQWLEVAVLLAVAVLPDLVNAAASFSPADHGRRVFWIDALMLIQRSATVCAVALFLMWASGEGWRRFGLTKWSWRADPPVAVVLVLLGWLVSGYVYSAAAAIFPPAEMVEWHFDRPSSRAGLLLLGAMSAANGLAEELVIWGFLYTRLAALTGRGIVMIPVCAAVFASYHLYQGPAAMLAIFAIGLIHGVCFWRLRRLWPLIIAHAIWDFAVYLM